ncbi:MAG: pyridoxal 5'-phosphate synthase glutaminase subunit PdxT [Candidatus Thermoplasmatota archaeon]|nr:pyridoxal 5'-phosphate synthase glutaminase subunit PdxT [Candidatus Thermoplasmatota archaeon]
MVGIVIIGVLSLQGAVSEHLASMNRVFQEGKKKGQAIIVRQPRDIDACDALIVPGGESTTISRILNNSGMYRVIRERMNHHDIAIMGTCAGCVLLAKELTDTSSEIRLLEAMDMQVERNAYGRQKESFEQSLQIKGFSTPYHAVFIRAPLITKTWGDCEILATAGKEIVMARQDKYLALSFHPELTDDLRIHRFFLEMS